MQYIWEDIMALPIVPFRAASLPIQESPHSVTAVSTFTSSSFLSSSPPQFTHKQHNSLIHFPISFLCIFFALAS